MSNHNLDIDWNLIQDWNQLNTTELCRRVPYNVVERLLRKWDTPSRVGKFSEVIKNGFVSVFYHESQKPFGPGDNVLDVIKDNLPEKDNGCFICPSQMRIILKVKLWATQEIVTLEPFDENKKIWIHEPQ